MRPHGSFAWNELLTSDPDRAMVFFAETLGWTYQSFDIGAPYWIIMSNDQMVGGLGSLSAGISKQRKAIGSASSKWMTSTVATKVPLRSAPSRSAHHTTYRASAALLSCGTRRAP